MTESERRPQLVARSEPLDLEPYAIPHPHPFLLDLTVERIHLGDIIEHVSNIEYVRWLDRAAELHSDALGYTRPWLLQRRLMWFVARHEVDYQAECWLGDELVIATWVRDFKRVKSWRDFAIVRPQDTTLVCRAATLWVLVDLDRRKPVQIDRAMIEQFAPLHVATRRSESIRTGGG
jgi:acyl-CoA thioester hydrolase